MQLAIVGYGYWGPNLLRNFSALEGCSVKTLCDLNIDRLKLAQKSYPNLSITSSLDEVMKDASIDAIVVATPVFMHYEIASKALQAGKHVLIEKPMTASVEEAEKLIELAEKYKKVLMVDHTFLYTGAVQKIKELIVKEELGKIQYFDSTRVNLGLFQPDVNVLWDLAPHDISILQYLINEKPFSVQATGISHTSNDIENIGYLTVNYQSNFIAHFHCSWTSPVKIRQMLIGGDKKMVLFNDMEPTEKIKVYDTGYNFSSDEERNKILVDYRVGDIFIPKIQTKEALAGMAADFLKAISTGAEPISSSKSALAVVQILEAAQVSIKNKGKEVIL